ncbi:MAG: glycoside hydrolase family 2 protein [Phycisphaerales bacterium]
MDTEARLYEMLEAAGLMGTCGAVDLGGDGWTVEAMEPGEGAPDVIRGRVLPARVPGCVHLDLIRAGIIRHPDDGDAERHMQWIGRTDWRYRKRFILAEPLSAERVDLVCQGLDTIASIRLDDRLLAAAANAHIPHRIPIDQDLAAGPHEIEIRFAGPMRHAERLRGERGDRPCNGDWGPYNYLRTPACSFGWDWGPQVAGVGITRGIRLHAWSGARISTFRPLVSRVTADEAILQVSVDVSHSAPDTDLSQLELLLRICDPDGRKIYEGRVGRPGGAAAANDTSAPGSASGDNPSEVDDGDGSGDGNGNGSGGGGGSNENGESSDAGDRSGTSHGRHDRLTAGISIRRPRRWWPRGLGDPDRYRLDVVLFDAEHALPLDAVTARIGLRSVELDTEPDERGQRFVLKINDEPVFCRGANWIPCGPFPADVAPATVRRRVQQAADAHMNMLRVWGGGGYEQDAFYDACDAAGIMVWQDVMLACATYPEEAPYPSLIEGEVRHQVARLSRHPSVVLWCGGNENIVAHRDWGWSDKMPADLTWGRRYWLEWLPRWIRQTDPTRPYWPDSPWSGEEERGPNDLDHGDRHTWDRRLEGYREVVPRFCSELGHQSPPTLAAMTRAIGADHLKIGDPQLEHRQRATGGFEQMYGVPFREHHGTDAETLLTDFELWHESAMSLQARAMHIACRAHVDARPDCMGLLIWQLNDCWAGHSWSLIDVDGHEKPSYHAVADVFRELEAEDAECAAQRVAEAARAAEALAAARAEEAATAADDATSAG